MPAGRMRQARAGWQQTDHAAQSGSPALSSFSAVMTEDALAAGRTALGRGAWAQARACFAAAVAEHETPEALEGLGLAAWWLDDARTMFDARERAYRLFVATGDRRGAARLATWLAWDYEAFRGELAVANGWLGRARRQLEGLEPSPELATLLLREAEMALRHGGGDARRLSLEAAEVARDVGSVELQVAALAVEGLALVCAGEVASGMRLLDEATAAAVSGELNDLTAIGSTCCRLISACEQVGDYERAMQWCERMTEFTRRWHMGALFAICRTQYASVLVGCGRWQEAESTLLEVGEELARRRPPAAAGSIARLGELRRRQGRTAEAAALFAQAERHPLALLGRAELALEAGHRGHAEELVRSFLRGVETQNRLERALGLELLVRIDPASDRAHAALEELRDLARMVGTTPLRAAATFAEALVRRDRDRLEEAIDLFEAAGEPYEAARARAALARETGEPRHEEAARAAFAKLSGDARQASVLSPREIEVLRLVCEGLSDPEIAARLFLSEHTVHRHVANIRTKLRQPSRAAAAAHAARAGLL
jgi:DNA-binding CsgD family transcriptional regulator